MTITKLAHISLRTSDLSASRRFYVDILGLQEGYRPDFNFPGAWLYRGGDEADFGVVHLIEVDSKAPQGLIDYLGDKCIESLHGSGAVDHLAFLANNLAEMRHRLRKAEFPFRERTVPALGLHQIFLEDPSGVTIELNFPAHEAEERIERRNGLMVDSHRPD